MVEPRGVDEEPRVLLHVGGFPPPFQDLQRTLHPRGWTGEPHRHEHWQFVINRGGTAEVTAERGVVTEVGEVAVLPPGLTHAWRNRGEVGLDLMNVHVLDRQPGFGDLYQYLRGACASVAPPAVCPAQPQVLRLAERAQAELAGGEHGYKYQAAAALTELVVAVLRGLWSQAGDPRSDTHLRIERVLWYLEQHYPEPLSLRDIGRLLHVTPQYACELLTQHTGLSPMQHLRRVRLEKARAFLEDTALSVKQVAFAVGFRDEHYFSRLFRKATGAPPSRYRARFRH